ncbi:MAG: energy transducer TonB [Terriglobales bacterium]
MASLSLADQLEDAIDVMMSKGSPLPREVDPIIDPIIDPIMDPTIGDLLALAAELRLLPDPTFKMALKEELLGECHPARTSPRFDIPRHAGNQIQASAALILPTLFGASGETYPVHRSNFAISAVLHAAVIVAVTTTGLWLAKQPQLAPHTRAVVLTELIAPALPPGNNRGGGGGGGGDRDKLAESHGSLPRFANEQIAPPAIVVRDEQPKLAVEPTIVGPPEVRMPQTSQVGNPLPAILRPPSNGTGTGGGIGNGEGGGVGSGYGPGFGPGRGGGTGGGAFRVGGGVSAPKAIYDPDPEYSEEARRAKYQGTVLLWIVVGADGKPRDIRVERSLGMGLDEKAIEAVKQWRFEPSLKDGQPVAVQVNIEVSFRLY